MVTVMLVVVISMMTTDDDIENNDDENTGRGNTFEACRGEMHFWDQFETNAWMTFTTG